MKKEEIQILIYQEKLNKEDTKVLICKKKSYEEETFFFYVRKDYTRKKKILNMQEKIMQGNTKDLINKERL